jgi:6-pyruvoyl-tetrahydropterin synthase
MSNNSCIFLSNISVVDHAYIDHRGNVVGGSFNPSFLVSGEVDPVEQVVVDFSAVKKQIKNIIDDKEIGFDHKLWFIQGYSNGTLSQTENYYTINTPTTELRMPINAVTVVPDGIYSIDAIGRHMGALVERELSKLHPKINIRVECLNSVDAHFPTNARSAALFRYAHGLKESTSWGCKNIAHGHLSYVQLLPVTDATVALVETITQQLDDTIFVFRDNIIQESDEWMMIGYTTERGGFEAQYKKDAYKLVVLETETTVEHLVDYVVGAFAEDFETTGVSHLLVSEGLSKGACATIDA